jgi:hypothetical protein
LKSSDLKPLTRRLRGYFRLIRRSVRRWRGYVKAHHVSRAALVLGGITAALLFFVVGAGIRLLIGPVSLGPFDSTLANALKHALPGITVKYDQAAVEWARDEGKVNLVILGARVYDKGGRIIAQAPKADIDLAAGPFLAGKVAVQRITLVGVQLTLVRTPDGGLRLGVEKDRSEEDIIKRISDAITASKGKPSSLKTLAIRNARLAFYDETTGLFVVAPQADFSLGTKGTDLDAKLEASIEISGHPAHIAAEFSFPPSGARVDGALVVSGFEVAALSANSKTFAAVKDTALKVDLSASFTVEASHLISADFGADAKGAFVVPGINNGLVRVHSMHALGRYDGKSGRLLLSDAAIDADKIKARLTGHVDLGFDQKGTLARLASDLRLQKLALALPGVFAQPVQFEHVDFRGAWLVPTDDIVIDHLVVAGTPLSLQASGKLGFAPGLSPAIEVKGVLAPLGVRDFLHYWPLLWGKGARDWADANMPVGTVSAFAFETHIAPGDLDASVLPENALSVKLALSGAEIIYLKGLTHLTALQGTAKLTGKALTVDISSARIGPLAVSAAHFSIPDLNLGTQIGVISAHVQGSLPDMLSLVDMPPLGYASRFGVAPAETKGEVALDLQARLPMLRNVGADQVNILVKANVVDQFLSLGPHTNLTDGQVSFLIDNKKLHASGTTGIGGSAARVSVDWDEDFTAAKPVTTKIAVKGTLDQQARDALGFHTDDYLKGPITVSGTLTGHRGALQQANATLDLTQATLTLDLIGVDKPAGFPASAHVLTTFGAKSAIASQSLRITGPSVTVAANLKFDAGGHLVQLQAPVVHISPQDDFSLDLERNPAGLNITVRGHSLDGTRLARHGSGEDDETLDEPFHIDAKLDRLALRNGVALAPFALEVTGVADRPTSLTLSASLSKTATLTGSITPSDDGRRVSFATNDVAMLVKGLFGFESLRGGKLDFRAILPGKAGENGKDRAVDFQGKAVMNDFRVIDQPFLARLFAAGSLTGLANLMQGQGIAVDSLEVPFSSKDGVLSIRDARATGPAIGITAEGYIDRPKNDIALKGSLVPLFGINSVLGNIPLIGDVLTSKQGEGIFGMTYNVSGNADEPEVSVNPLAALAPGIFRRIFLGRMPTPAQAPSNAPKPSAPAKPATTPPPQGTQTPPASH